MDVILMGLRGCGKSTLARMLSAATGLPCADLDDRVAALLGQRSATDAWNAYGEGVFRATEVRALHQALDDATPIIALGGGTPVAPGAFEILARCKRKAPARIIYLRGAAETLALRMNLDRARPSLTGADPIAEVPAILADREPVFLKLADAVVDIDHQTPEETAATILALS